MSDRETAIVLNVGDVVWARPCVVTIMHRVGQVAYGYCDICEVEHIIDRASYEAGLGPWQPQNGSQGATVRCKRCGGSPVVAEVEGRTLVCATCRDDAEFRAHAREDYR